MAVECVRASVADTIAFAFLVSISFILQGCGNGSPSAFMNGGCEDWCEDDQYRVENGKSHKARHCGAGDMSAQCGGCPYCGGSNHNNDNNPGGGSNHGRDACEDWCEDDKWKHEARHCGAGDMSDLCGGCPYCGGTGHDDGNNHDSGNDHGDGDCCTHCAGHPHCSPKSGYCHNEKPEDKEYYLDCDGSVPAPSPGNSNGNSNSCLCVFDIDRTLTAKQGTANECPGTRETQYYDDAYDSGNAVLSALAATGIRTTFCGHCYLGICSHGHASGANSDWANYLMNTVVRSDVHDTFMERIPGYKKWSYGTDVDSPYILKTENGQKQVAVENMRQWYGRQGARINPSEVYFFGDHTSNIPPFASKNFNAREISCDSREGHIGRCGARSEEIRDDKGIHSCR